MDSVLIISYYTIDKTENCFNAEAVKTGKVAFLKPVVVLVYDLYDKSKN
jgi:hypothetical protein